MSDPRQNWLASACVLLGLASVAGLVLLASGRVRIDSELIGLGVGVGCGDLGLTFGFLGQLPSPPSFQTGAACLLQVEGRNGRFEWMLDPHSLERRAR